METMNLQWRSSPTLPGSQVRAYSGPEKNNQVGALYEKGEISAKLPRTPTAAEKTLDSETYLYTEET